MDNWTVYKHVSPSGKVYVGISSNVKNRWAVNGYYYCLSDTIFSRALRKYGWDNFEHIIIQDGLNKQEACDMEKELIAYYKAHNISYNITDGGEGFCGKHTDEHNRHKIESRIANNDVDYLVIDKDFNYIICKTEKEAAEFLDGVPSNIAHVLKQPVGYTFRKHYIWKHTKGSPVNIDEIKSCINNALILRKQKMSNHAKMLSSVLREAVRKERVNLTEEERKLRYGHGKTKGKHHSEETKKKMSDRAKGRDMTKAVIASAQKNSKPVVQILNGVVINTFCSIREASNTLNINYSNISQCVLGNRKTAGKYTWVLKDNKEDIYVN